MNIDYMVIGNRIKEARKAKNITQEYLSELLNVSPTYVSRVERGSTKINLEMLVKISGLLEVLPAYLLTGAVMNSVDYMKDELACALKKCSPEKVKAITQMVKIISEL